MYKIAAALIVLMLFASCHSDGIGMDVGKEVSPDESPEFAMEEITVTWLGSVTPTYYVKSITVDAGRQITVNIERYNAEQVVEGSCSASTEVTEDDYQIIKDNAAAADLLNYEPPAEGDEDCITQEGSMGIEVTYSVAGGDSSAFSTGSCQLETEIDNIAVVMSGLAKKYVTDCTEELLTPAADAADTNQ